MRVFYAAVILGLVSAAAIGGSALCRRVENGHELERASRGGDLERVRALLRQSANPNQVSPTPLEGALDNGHFEVAAVLMAHDARILNLDPHYARLLSQAPGRDRFWAQWDKEGRNSDMTKRVATDISKAASMPTPRIDIERN